MRQLNQVEQNHRKSNIEINGIPDDVDNESLKAAVVRIVNYVTDGNFTTGDVEACHRLGARFSPKPTIVRMRRNILETVKTNSKKLKNVDVALNFRKGTRIFIQDNQSPTMKKLAFNARCLKDEGVIQDTWFSNAAVRIKAAGKVHKVTHEMDLIKIAPKYGDFSFNTTFGCRVLYENPDFMDFVRMDRLDGVMQCNDSILDPEAIANSVRPLEDDENA